MLECRPVARETSVRRENSASASSPSWAELARLRMSASKKWAVPCFWFLSVWVSAIFGDTARSVEVNSSLIRVPRETPLR